jgi:hypothetical protein
MPLTPSRIQTRTRLLKTMRKAAYFNGSNAYVVVPEPSSVVGARKLSVVVWVNPLGDYTSLWDAINEDWNGDWAIKYGWNHLYGRLWFTDGTCTSLDFGKYGYVPGTWGMLFFGWDIDAGLIKGFNSWTGKTTTTTVDPSKQPRNAFYKIYIGGIDNYLLGYMSQVLIYSRLLSDSEIQQIYNYLYNPITNGLVLWLDGDSLDCTNGKWWDKSGFGNHGTLYNVQCVDVVSTPTRVQTPVR